MGEVAEIHWNVLYIGIATRLNGYRISPASFDIKEL